MDALPKTLPSFKSFVDHNPEVGTEAMLITGLPGQAKSTIAHSLGSWGLDRNNIIVMRGSKSCEWRHFLNVEACEKITVFISEKLHYKENKDAIKFKRIPEKFLPWIPKSKSKKNDDLEFKYVDLETLNLEEYIRPRQVFVLYDHCFTPAERSWLMVDQLTNLVNRSDNDYIADLDEIPILYIEHESQIVWPMCALSPKKVGISGRQWHALNYMQNLAVDFRKDLVKPVYVAQLHTQFSALLRDLCIFRILKKGLSGNNMPESVRKSTPFLEINEANIVVGFGSYLKQVKISKFPETTHKWKMIPRKFIDYICNEERRKGKEGLDKYQERLYESIRNMYKEGMTIEYIARLTGYSTTQIWRIIHGE